MVITDYIYVIRPGNWDSIFWHGMGNKLFFFLKITIKSFVRRKNWLILKTYIYK